MSDDRMSTADMSDERISQALKALPRDSAGLGFTARVLRRVENAPPWWSPVRLLPSSWTPRQWTAMAAAAVLVLSLGFGWREWHHRQAAANLKVLLAEKQELKQELKALRQLAADARPTVYLGGDGEVDLVLDLARFQRQGGFGSRPVGLEKSPARSRPAITSPVAVRGEQAVAVRGEQAVAVRGEQAVAVRGERTGRQQTVRPLRVVY